MKIWLMNRYYYPNVGGIENSLFYISKALTEQGHSVIYLRRNWLTRKQKEGSMLILSTIPIMKIN